MVRFLFLISVLSVLNVHADENSFSDRHIYPVLKKGTDSYSGATFLSGVLATLIARDQDDFTRSEWRKSSKISDSEAHIGDLIGTGAGSLLIMGGQYVWDPQISHTESHLRGFVFGGISIYALKTAFGRNRPGNSDSHQSFPSGHTAISFMTATHLAYAYGWETALVAFPVATFVGITRLHDDAHWLSDTVAGAFLGVLVGRATFYDSSTLETQTEKNRYYQILPVVQNEYAGVSFYVSY